MKAMINNSHIEGWLYQHSLELKESGPQSKNPGTKFIAGNLEVATDNEGINIIPVHFTYVTATTSAGKANATFNTLMDIIDGAYKTIMKDGKDSAAKVRIDSAIGLNEFYSDRTGTEELVSVKRNEGGFVHLANSLDEDESKRNTFTCDMLITGATRVEADEEKQIPEKVIVKGAIFDFRKNLLPVEFSATNPGAINYFEGLGASSSEPVFTKIWGQQISEVVVRTVTEESAFGADSVREYKSTKKDFVITGAAKEPYIWDDAETLTVQELTEAMAARQTTLATLKQRNDEYKASKKTNTAGTTTSVATGGFNF